MTYIRPLYGHRLCLPRRSSWQLIRRSQGHRLEPAASPAKDDMARMDIQMKSMQEMNEKMMSAKTPKSANALMAESHDSHAGWRCP